MKDKQYYPDEQGGTANIVREIFERYANGEKQRVIAISLGERGVRTKQGNMPENRWIDYILRNPCYIGKIRWSLEGVRAVSKRDYNNDNIMVVDSNHEPLISIDLWNKVQKMLDAQKTAYPKYARREQPIEYSLKGLIRCGACGATLACNGPINKSGVRSLQCCNYSRGSCHTSHSITITKIEAAFIEALKQAVEEKQFLIIPKERKKSDPTVIDYNKLIAVEERRLERAREAYLAEIDTIEQYAKNKTDITARIDDLRAKRDRDTETEINVDVFAEKVIGIIEFVEREDVSAIEKNEALRTIIEKIVYEKAKGNLAIYFHAL